MSNIDSRGIKRGPCECGNCNELEWISSEVGSCCTYCGCVPVKHAKLEKKTDTWSSKYIW